eukprot:scaffold182415_cov45-Prasinocladus_malaysianus.AAC.1
MQLSLVCVSKFEQQATISTRAQDFDGTTASRTSTDYAANETRSTHSTRSVSGSAPPTTGFTGIEDYLGDFSMSESLLSSVRRGVSGTPASFGS